jgi:hypothetical protein
LKFLELKIKEASCSVLKLRNIYSKNGAGNALTVALKMFPSRLNILFPSLREEATESATCALVVIPVTKSRETSLLKSFSRKNLKFLNEYSLKPKHLLKT